MANTSHRLHTAPGRRLSLALALAASTLAAGCATSAPKTRYVWPPPPETTRIEYVRTFRTADDLSPSFGRRLLMALLPHDPAAGVRTPVGLALSADERFLYVTGAASGRVLKIEVASARVEVIGGSTAATKPVVPFGVAVDEDGTLFVSDRTRGEVLVYDADGRFVRSFGKGLLERPTSMALDRKAQQLYVVNGATSTRTDHRIEVFSPKGDHVRTVGKRGAATGEFNFPAGLFVSADGTLYVADMLNFRVQMFDRQGGFLGSFGRLGTGFPGAFDKIKDVGFDTFGNVYVLDARQGVHVLNDRRQPLLLFGGPPFMAVPDAMVIDSRNVIYVADFGSDAIHQFRLVDATTPAAAGPTPRGVESPPPAAPAPVSPAAEPAAPPAQP